MGPQNLATLEFPADARGGAAGRAPRRPLRVTRLTLTDFRCYRHQRLEPDPDGLPVVLAGPNGAGKTNVLEALSFLVPGRGLRRARLADVARRRPGGEALGPGPWGVAAALETPAGPVELGTGFEGSGAGGRDKRAVHVDGEAAKSQAALAEHMSVQWLTPQMDRLFVDGPAARRRFLDRLVFDTDPAHAGRVNAYEHAMRERMRLLRAGGADARWLATLEDTMAAKGVAVAAARLDVARRLGARLAEDTGAFPRAAVETAGTVEGWLAEGPALAAEDKLREALAAGRARDAAEGGTAAGPHRSDLSVRHLDTGERAEDCSTGEQKALLVALVLATARMRAAERGAAPVLLLDEVAAHLDKKRLAALFDEIQGLGAQVWLTGTDAGLFRPLEGRARFFDVEAGNARPAA